MLGNKSKAGAGARPLAGVDGMDEEVSCTGNYGGGGDGKDPGPDDTSRDAPADGGETVNSAHADDRASNRVRSANRNSRQRGAKQSDGPGAFCAESAEWL